MRSIRFGVFLIMLLAATAGCVALRPSWEQGEKVALSQVLQQTLRHYEGINTLQAHLFIQLELRDEYYVLRGLLLYERPDRVRLQLSSSLGNTVGEVIYNAGLLSLLLPSKGLIYQGRIEEEAGEAKDTRFLIMLYDSYKEIEGRRFPTRIYGEGESMPLRFTVLLKDPEVDRELPEGAFTPPPGEWELHPLSELKGQLSGMEGKEK